MGGGSARGERQGEQATQAWFPSLCACDSLGGVLFCAVLVLQIRFSYTEQKVSRQSAFRPISAFDAKARRHSASRYKKQKLLNAYSAQILLLTCVLFSRGGALHAGSGGCEGGTRAASGVRGGRRGSARGVRRPPYLRLPHGKRWAAAPLDMQRINRVPGNLVHSANLVSAFLFLKRETTALEHYRMTHAHDLFLFVLSPFSPLSRLLYYRVYLLLRLYLDVCSEPVSVALFSSIPRLDRVLTTSAIFGSFAWEKSLVGRVLSQLRGSRAAGPRVRQPAQKFRQGGHPREGSGGKAVPNQEHGEVFRD